MGQARVHGIMELNEVAGSVVLGWCCGLFAEASALDHCKGLESDNSLRNSRSLEHFNYLGDIVPAENSLQQKLGQMWKP